MVILMVLLVLLALSLIVGICRLTSATFTLWPRNVTLRKCWVSIAVLQRAALKTLGLV